MVRKRGRPKKDDSKLHRIGLRVTDQELENIRYVCRMSKNDITKTMLEGIRMQANYYHAVEQNPELDGLYKNEESSYDSDYYDYEDNFDDEEV